MMPLIKFLNLFLEILEVIVEDFDVSVVFCREFVNTNVRNISSRFIWVSVILGHRVELFWIIFIGNLVTYRIVIRDLTRWKHSSHRIDLFSTIFLCLLDI